MFPWRPAIASCRQDVRWESLRGSYLRAHLESVCSFHLDVFIRLLSTANYGLYPTVLDLVMVGGDYRVELTCSFPLLSRHKFTVSSELVDVLLHRFRANTSSSSAVSLA